MPEAMKKLLTTNTTKKAVLTAALVPFLVVVFCVWTGKMQPADFHQHLSDYTKWIIGTFLVSKAGLDGAGLIANRNS